MAVRSKWILLALLQWSWWRPASCRLRQYELSVKVEPGAKECFFVDGVLRGMLMTVDFQVYGASAPTGNYDVTVQLLGPNGTLIREEVKLSHQTYEFRVEEDGDHQVCLDNSYSAIAEKVVVLFIDVNDFENDDYDDDISEEELEEMRVMDKEEEEEWQLTVEELKTSLHRIRSDINTVSYYQEQFLTSYSQDMSMAERNAEKVAMWSLAHLSVLVAVAVIQVFMVQSLFSDRSFRYKMERLHSRLESADEDDGGDDTATINKDSTESS